MDSTLIKATTLLFLVATFCLAGITTAEDDDGHPVTASVHPPADSPFSPLPPQLVNPPADSPVSPPFSPPVDPPADSPVSPPLAPPVDPPAHPPVPRSPYLRGIVAVKGAVFCQSCKHAGSDDLTGASPIEGAVVKVQCKNDEKVLELTATTYTRGFFFAQKRNVTTYAFDNCKAYLVSSPLATCNIPTDLHGGITGAKLKRRKPLYLLKPSYTVYSVKPFAFLPKCN